MRLVLTRIAVTAQLSIIALVALTIPVPVLGCTLGTDSANSASVTVFAAGSLTEAFTEVAAAFEEANPAISVDLNFAGSQRLRVQLENGARADVYASADQRHMDLAIDAGLVAGEASNFASNALVIALPKSEAADLADSSAEGKGSSAEDTPGEGPLVRSPADLAKKGIKLAIAQPEVPAGNYTRTMIQRLSQDPKLGPSYPDRVLANVVSEEASVRNVLQKVALGEVDAGIIYRSDAQVTSDVSVIPIPDAANITASYTIALLRDSRQREAAEAFLKFVLGPDGQGILDSHGLGPPVAGGPTSKEESQ